MSLAFAATVGIAAGSSAFAAEFTFKLAQTNAPGEIQVKGTDYFAKRVNELTRGRVEIQSFPNGQLGAELPSIEGVQLGTIGMTLPANAAFSNFVPLFRVLDLPFVVRDGEHLDKVASGPAFDTLRDAAAKRGFRLLGTYSSGVRHIMTTFPVNSMSDLKNRKIRTFQNPIHVEAFKSFGANATPLSYGELYGALQAGLVDGADAANTNYFAQKFYEVAPYWAMVGWLTLTADLVMSEAKFKSLPTDVQNALVQAGAESAKWERALAIQSEEPLLEQIKAKGVHITHPDREPFEKAAASLYEKLLTTPEEKELLTKIQKTK
jgi:tripartite ATP-independent periplasmic transporter solute receptor, DctP family